MIGEKDQHFCSCSPVIIAKAISTPTVPSVIYEEYCQYQNCPPSNPFPVIHMVWPVTPKLGSVSRCQTNCCQFDGSTPFPAKAAAARLPYRGLVWSGMPHRGQICRVGRGGWHHNASLMPWHLFQQHPHATKGATHHFSLAREVSEH